MTTPTRRMLDSMSVAATHPDLFAACLDACAECAQTCTACADACLREETVADLRRCIALNLGCADLCAVTGRIAGRRTEADAAVLRAALEACIVACRGCGEECRAHGEHGMTHCAVCAEACGRCERACRELLSAGG